MSDQPAGYQLDPRYLAAVKLLERAGAKSYRIMHSDEDLEPPVVWNAIAEFRVYHGIAFTRHYHVAAALEPVTATLRLCESVVDGARCVHCGQLTIFVADTNTDLLDRMGCVYAWDPELETFRRGCEGDAP